MTTETILKQTATILKDLEINDAIKIISIVGFYDLFSKDTIFGHIQDIIEEMKLDMETDEIIELVDKIIALKED